MSQQEDLVVAFTEGRISRRAFVRQLVDGGMSMPAALSYAEALSPEKPASDGAGSDAAASSTPSAPSAPAGMAAKPTQVDDLEVNFVGDGYVVYHPARDRMHSLNNTAAVVLELCTGENDASEIARLLQQAFQLPEPPDEETRHCLSVLFDEGLIR